MTTSGLRLPTSVDLPVWRGPRRRMLFLEEAKIGPRARAIMRLYYAVIRPSVNSATPFSPFCHEPTFAPGYRPAHRADSRRRSARDCFHSSGSEWVPRPRVRLLVGMRPNLPP